MSLIETLRITTKKWVLIGFGVAFLGWNLYAHNLVGITVDSSSAAIALWLCAYAWVPLVVGIIMGGFLWPESVQKAWERLRDRFGRGAISTRTYLIITIIILATTGVVWLAWDVFVVVKDELSATITRVLIDFGCIAPAGVWLGGVIGGHLTIHRAIQKV